MDDFKPVVIVPVYLHGSAFSLMLPRLLRFGLPIIVVDDGSDSDSARLLQALAAGHNRLYLKRHELNRGKGAAVATGLKKAETMGFTHALQIDGDGQHDAGDIPAFLAAARNNPGAVVLGVPKFDASMPVSRRIGRYLTHVWIWIETWSLDIADSMCGFRVYPLSAVMPLLDVRGLGTHMDFDPEILVRLHWKRTPFLRIPTRVIYPASGRSNFKLITDNLLITLMHIRLVAGMLIRSPLLIFNRLANRRGDCTN
ncbi:MAG: glycosyltransferase family 2 protein [Gammaproteobacteria bacterium]|nr:glycosyltransferase family 2 protein [Gammaproteobacteria bacterium]